jgi:hypothetical protein
MSYYRPLGSLAVEVHAGGRYVPLSAARANGQPEWAPVVPRSAPGTPARAPAGSGDAGGPGAAAASAVLRVSLQRLFTPGGPGAKRQPLWLYVNHLGWCRGCAGC